MKIVLASDPFGVELKNAVAEHLREAGHEIVEVGAKSTEDKVFYVEAAHQLSETLLAGNCERGILFCGTGAGVSIVANKHKGVYCVPCESVFTAFKSAQINNANVISMGANVVGQGNACKIADVWLESKFAMDSGADRCAFLSGLLGEIHDLEEKNFK